MFSCLQSASWKAVHPSTKKTFISAQNLLKVRKPALTDISSTGIGKNTGAGDPFRRRPAFRCAAKKKIITLSPTTTRASTTLSLPENHLSTKSDHFTVQKARFRRGTCEDLLLTNGETGPIASELRGNEPQQIWCLLVENDAGKLLAGTAHGKEVWVWDAHRFSAPQSKRGKTDQIQKFEFTVVDKSFASSPKFTRFPLFRQLSSLFPTKGKSM